MRSIALFPCSYTDEARIIGELSNSLHLRVYSDEMLFSDISEQFGIPVEKLKKILYKRTPDHNRSRLEKIKYINLLKCSLQARKRQSHSGCIFYGLHTSLFDTKNDRVLKVLVFDELEGRVRRAMQQEGFSEEAARNFIIQHDNKAAEWTRFLFHAEPYARSLYHYVITYRNKSLFDIVSGILHRFHEVDYSRMPHRLPSYAPAVEIHSIDNRIGRLEYSQPDHRP